MKKKTKLWPDQIFYDRIKFCEAGSDSVELYLFLNLMPVFQRGEPSRGDGDGRWLVTETGEDTPQNPKTGEDTPQNPNSSYHNMLRTGFMLAYQRPNYMAQA